MRIPMLHLLREKKMSSIGYFARAALARYSASKQTKVFYAKIVVKISQLHHAVPHIPFARAVQSLYLTFIKDFYSKNAVRNS